MKRIRSVIENESSDGITLIHKNHIDELKEIATTNGLIVYYRVGMTEYQEIGSSEIHQVNPHTDMNDLFRKHDLIIIIDQDYKEKITKVTLSSWKEIESE